MGNGKGVFALLCDMYKGFGTTLYINNLWVRKEED